MNKQRTDDEGHMHCTPLPLVPCRWSALLAALLFCAAQCGITTACDTPVYRYAMYRWQPTAYELYCFYDRQLDDTGVAIQDTVERLSGSQPPAANLLFLPVDVEQDRELKGVPPDVKSAWLQSPQRTPWYLVASPVGRHLHAGALTADDVEALVESPCRTRIGELLEAGRAGVYVLLTGDDPGANQRAEAEVHQVLDDLAAGRLTLYAPPNASTAANNFPTPEFGLVTLARQEPQEKWLIHCLLAVEPDLRESAEPMVFLVYGRGGALFSCLGKGICRENLEQDVAFITGACSCIVKEQNPGVDLLMRFDWGAVAAELSQRFGAEEGSLDRFGGDLLFPELMLPTEELAPPSAEATAPDALVEAAPPATEPLAAAEFTHLVADTRGTRLAGVDSAIEVLEAQPGAPAGTDRSAPGSATDQPTTEEAASDLRRVDPVAHAWQATLWVGGGLAGALAVLLAATWLVLRPR